MIDLTPIINAVIALIAAVIAYWVIPWVKAKTTNEQQANMRAAIKTLVFAAEQTWGAGHGSEKLDFVIEQLRLKGYNVDRVEIEAAVGEYINNWPIIKTAVEVTDKVEIEED